MTIELHLPMESAAHNLDTALSAQLALPRKSQAALALLDLKEGLKKWPVWFMLAYQDIKLRYRRSVLGPFWITLSMAITVYSMGFLYGHLFHSDLKTYFPFLVSGMLSWALISSAIIDLTEAFTGSEALIKQIKLPYSLYVHRIVTRNILVFFHNIIVIVPIIIIFPETAKINMNTLMLIPGLAIIYINAFFYGLAMAMIGARYRDVLQIIKSLVQVAFFVTPVMWDPSILPAKDRFIANFNPFYSFVEFIRAPLTGKMPALSHWIMVAIVTSIGIGLSFLIFKKCRARIVYWI